MKTPALAMESSLCMGDVLNAHTNTEKEAQICIVALFGNTLLQVEIQIR